MTRQKVGLVFFGIAVLWAILWGILGSVFANEAYHLARAEVNQTMWAMNGPWLPIWGLLGVPVGARPGLECCSIPVPQQRRYGNMVPQCWRDS